MLSVKVDNADAVKLLSGLMEGVQDFSPVWPKVERIVMKMEDEQFESEGKYGGTDWEPLNRTYAEYKAKVYGDRGILVRTGIMRTSLTTKGGAGHYYNAGPNFVEVGTTIPYAKFHQRGNAKLPRRVVIPSPPEEIGSAIRFAVLEHIFKKANQAVRGR